MRAKKKPAYCAHCQRWFATGAGLSAHKRAGKHTAQAQISQPINWA